MTRISSVVLRLYNVSEILLEKQADWLICQGRETIEEVFKGMFSILCMHFFIALNRNIKSESATTSSLTLCAVAIDVYVFFGLANIR